MITFDKMAERVAGNMKGGHAGGGAFMQLLAMFLQEILPKLMENCAQTAKGVVQTAKNPGRWDKIWLKRQSRQTFGRRGHKEIGGDVIAATLKTVKKADPEEIDALYEQVS